MRGNEDNKNNGCYNDDVDHSDPQGLSRSVFSCVRWDGAVNRRTCSYFSFLPEDNSSSWLHLREHSRPRESRMVRCWIEWWTSWLFVRDVFTWHFVPCGHGHCARMLLLISLGILWSGLWLLVFHTLSSSVAAKCFFGISAAPVIRLLLHDELLK